MSNEVNDNQAIWDLDADDFEAWLGSLDNGHEAWVQSLQTDPMLHATQYGLSQPSFNNHLACSQSSFLPSTYAETTTGVAYSSGMITAAPTTTSLAAAHNHHTATSASHSNRRGSSRSARSTTAATGGVQIQCFDHGCNGRTFSSRENYYRHLREKSGQGAIRCRFCGHEFTRRSNRDKHVADGKCVAMMSSRSNSAP